MAKGPPRPKRPPKKATPAELREAIRSEALKLGFDAVGFAPASLDPAARAGLPNRDAREFPGAQAYFEAALRQQIGMRHHHRAIGVGGALRLLPVGSADQRHLTIAREVADERARVIPRHRARRRENGNESRA